MAPGIIGKFVFSTIQEIQETWERLSSSTKRGWLRETKVGRRSCVAADILPAQVLQNVSCESQKTWLVLGSSSSALSTYGIQIQSK